jgi:CRP-like cAMP-binding protein
MRSEVACPVARNSSTPSPGSRCSATCRGRSSPGSSTSSRRSCSPTANGSGFFVILDGEANVVVDGQVRAKLTRGDFFGEASILLGEPPIADVVALRPMTCLVLPGPGLERFLVAHPRVLFRLLQAQTRRLQGAQRYRG